MTTTHFFLPRTRNNEETGRKTMFCDYTDGFLNENCSCYTLIESDQTNDDNVSVRFLYFLFLLLMSHVKVKEINGNNVVSKRPLVLLYTTTTRIFFQWTIRTMSMHSLLLCLHDSSSWLPRRH